jgi:hypothetical protein
MRLTMVCGCAMESMMSWHPCKRVTSSGCTRARVGVQFSGTVLMDLQR